MDCYSVCTTACDLWKTMTDEILKMPSFKQRKCACTQIPNFVKNLEIKNSGNKDYVKIPETTVVRKGHSHQAIFTVIEEAEMGHRLSLFKGRQFQLRLQ